MQVDPIKPTLKALGIKPLKLKYDELLSSFAFKCNLRRYSWGFDDDEFVNPQDITEDFEVGRCRLTLSNPC